MALAWVFLSMAAQMSAACPICYGDLEPEQSRGFFWGIVFLMFLPPTLILYIGGHVVYSARKKAKADRLIERAESLIQHHP